MSDNSILVQNGHSEHQLAALPVELTAEQLRFQVKLPVQFQTTAELTPGHDFIG